MVNFYHREIEEQNYGHKIILSNIRVLILTAYTLWSDSLAENFKKFDRKLEVRTVLVEEEKRHLALAEAVETFDDIVLVVSPGYYGSELNFVEALRSIGCQSPIMVLCSNYILPSFEELQKLHVQGILSLNLTHLKDFEKAIYAVVDCKRDVLREQYVRASCHHYQPTVLSILSPFEKEILTMISADLKDKEVSERLGLSSRTISYHLSLIYAKLGVNTRAGAVGEALSKGIITPFQVTAAKLSTKSR